MTAPTTRLAQLIATATDNELRLLTAIAERMVSLRPRAGELDAPLIRDATGDVTAALQDAVDANLSATAALLAVRRRLT